MNFASSAEGAAERAGLLAATSRLFALAAAIAIGLSARSAAGADRAQTARIAGAEVGFNGLYKVGYWTPVRVTLEGNSEGVAGHLELITADGDNVPVRYTEFAGGGQRASPPSPPTFVLTGQPVTRTVYARFGSLNPELTVRLMAKRRTLAQRDFSAGPAGESRFIPAAQSATDRLYVTLGDALGIDEIVKPSTQSRGQLVHVAKLADAATLPDRWWGYEAVDFVVITTSDLDALRGLRSGSGQLAALDRWVRLGGRLLLSLGRSAPQAIGPDGPLTALVPGKFEAMQTLRSTTAIESYCSAQSTATADRRVRFQVPRLTDVRGSIEVFEGARAEDIPLVIRTARGFGTVVLAAFDLDRPPFDTWEDRTRLMRRLLRMPDEQQMKSAGSSSSSVNNVGYSDIAGQLRGALQEFPQVRVIPFWIVAAALVGYIAIIGPLDYWLVRKVIRRPEGTWVTFPIWVVLFCFAAHYAAVSVKGDRPHSNRIHLVDCDLESGLVRGSAWIGLFSADPRSYDLSFSPRLPAQMTFQGRPETLFSWMGLPGGALGGLQSGAGQPTLFPQAYDCAAGSDSIHKLPIHIWSTKELAVRYHGQADVPLQATLVQEDEEFLSGRITNQLGVDLVDARLFYKQWVYLIPQLRNGQELAVGPQLQSLTGRTLLTRRRILGESDALTVYDAQSTDVPRILDMMMFHELAGGAAYTQGLIHRYRRDCDLSGHLQVGRAVLVAQVDVPDDQLAVTNPPQDLQGTSQSVFRFVLPVDSARK